MVGIWVLFRMDAAKGKRRTTRKYLEKPVVLARADPKVARHVRSIRLCSKMGA